MSDSWDNLKAAFAEVVHQPTTKQQEAVAQLSSVNPVLGKALRELLDNYAQLETFLEISGDEWLKDPISTLGLLNKRDQTNQKAGVDHAVSWPKLRAAIEAYLPISEDLPQQIGAYRIVKKLGQGGMGVVYLAHHPFQKLVAVKVLQQVFDENLTTRFHQEREILASLSHPQIARLLDGGSDGERPFFAMNYVPGRDLNIYCREVQPSLASRLSLFQKICEGVAYAHRNLVVHRDLKPSNIHVTDTGDPVILDFGIAHLMEGAPGRHQTLTYAGQRLLTPEYAAPEQIMGQSTSTSCDIYSLGILLFEIVCGRRPYKIDRTDGEAMRAVICHQEIPAPGQMVRENKELPYPKISRDLEKIIEKVCRKDPRQRYLSVEELNLDLQRLRDGRPIKARGNTTRYRLGKFLLRNRLQVTAVTALFLLVVFLPLGYGFARAREQERTRIERDRALHVSQLLMDVFQATSPEHGKNVSAVQLLNQAERELDRKLIDSPGLRGALIRHLGQAYFNLGQYQVAEKILKSCEPLLEDAGEDFGDDLVATLTTRAQIAHYKKDFNQALSLGRRALNHHLRLPETSKVVLANDYRRLGLYYALMEEYDEAWRKFETTLGLLEQEPDPQTLAATYRDMATLARQLALPEEDLALLEEVVAIHRRHPEIRKDMLAKVYNNLALAYIQHGRYSQSEQTLRQAIELNRQVEASGPNLAIMLNNLAECLIRAGRIEEALVEALEAGRLFRQFMGKETTNLAAVHNNLGKIFMELGCLEDSQAHYREALRLRENGYGKNSRWYAVSATNLCNTLIKIGQLEEAERLALDALKIKENLLGPDHPSVAYSLMALTRLERKRNQPKIAHLYCRRALEIYTNHFPKDHPMVKKTIAELEDLTAAQ